METMCCEITLRYPELVDPDNSETNKLWPWYGDLVKYKADDGNFYNIRKPTTFMKHMKKTNTDRILSSCYVIKRKILKMFINNRLIIYFSIVLIIFIK